MTRGSSIGLALVLVTVSNCWRSRSVEPPSDPPRATQASPQSQKGQPSSPSVPLAEVSEIPYIKGKHVSYAGYQITVDHRRLNVAGLPSDVERAVVMKDGRLISVFDRVRQPLGVSIRFALAPLLGRKDKQLVVEQTGPRAWAYWVVEVVPRSGI